MSARDIGSNHTTHLPHHVDSSSCSMRRPYRARETDEIRKYLQNWIRNLLRSTITARSSMKTSPLLARAIHEPCSSIAAKGEKWVRNHASDNRTKKSDTSLADIQRLPRQAYSDHFRHARFQLFRTLERCIAMEGQRLLPVRLLPYRESSSCFAARQSASARSPKLSRLRVLLRR